MCGNGANLNFADRIEDPDFRRLFQYWEARRGDRRAAHRKDIDPTDLGPLLGDLLLIEATGSPPDWRFRFRLHGTRLAEKAGIDLTGRYVEDMPQAENREWLLRRLASLLDSGEPQYGMHERIVDDRWTRYEVLWLPLLADGRSPTMFLGALRYRDLPKLNVAGVSL
jgi:hypothetical protein